MEIACREGNIGVVQQLLDEGVDPSTTRGILCAAEKGHANIVRLLSEYPNVNPNAENSYGI
jgi:hypothetical protein